MWFIASAWAGTALVLADRDARDAGVELEVDGTPIDATLPVEVERDLELVVIVDEVARSTWIEEGLVYVVGEDGRVRASRPGIQVAADAVRVVGDEEIARTLAEDLGAELVPDRDGWRLHANGLLEELSRVAVPDGDLDVVLLRAEERPRGSDAPRSKKVKLTRPGSERKGITRTRAASRFRPLAEEVAAPAPAVAAIGGHPADRPEPAARPPELVAWYCDALACVVLGVDGRAHRCDDAGCVEAGPWTETAGGIRVGALDYAWRDGVLVVTP